MADANVIQTSFAGGEFSPSLYARVDLAKYHTGAATMRNFFVDYRGGASSRPGTQFMGLPAVSSSYVRLIPFVFSSTIGQSYILVFSHQKLQFIKNPGTVPSYPNSSNAGFILSGMSAYTINTPYAAADLPLLKFSQSADVMYLTHPSYPRQVLSRISDTNWTLTNPINGSSIANPLITSISITGLPPGSTDPQNTSYLYTVTSVDMNGQESNFTTIGHTKGIDIAATQGSVTLQWTPVAGAKYYKVYKAISTPGNVVPSLASAFGFVGYAYGSQFTDGNIVPDFSQTPPLHKDPFPGGGSGGDIEDYTIVSAGSGFPNYPPALPISDPTGGGAFIYPITSNNAYGGTGGIQGLRIINGGSQYSNITVDPTIGGTGTGFAVSFTLGPAQNPRCSAFFQQRLMYASTGVYPVRMWGSKPGFYSNFDMSNPPLDSDSLDFSIAGQQVNAIYHMVPMPGGLVLFTSSSVQQLTGGSGNPNNPLAVTPSSAVIVPQSYYGCAEYPRPIVIDYQILYPQAEGSIIRELTYNFFVNIYTGVDISLLSSHLFYPNQIVDWAYQDVPNKVIWAVRSDGALLSLTYLKAQEISGWARHDSFGGLYESVASVREGNTEGVYFSVNRNGTRYIERLCDRVYSQLSDAWCLDCASSYVGTPITTVTGLSYMNGFTVMALADGIVRGPFTVSSGQITLPVAASKIVIGVGYTCDLQSLYLDIGNETNTIQGKRKKIAAMSVRVKDAANIKIGTSFSTLTKFNPGFSSTDPQLINNGGLLTGDQRISMDASYSVACQACVRQDDPLPVTVLAFIPEIVLGDSGR